MTTKDYIYLGLILLTALAFYCNGFYAGVYRCKRMYDTLLDDSETESETPSLTVKEGKFLSSKDKVLAFRADDALAPNRELRGNFGNN
jgi:hypothetical protein